MFDTPILPQSGVPGVVYNRYNKSHPWHVVVRGEYWGCFAELEAAKEFRARITTEGYLSESTK
jgi:hypothetical protein